MFQYLTPENWQTAFQKYPGLEALLTHMSLYNEELSLTNQLKSDSITHARRKWIENRLKDFEWLHGK